MKRRTDSKSGDREHDDPYAPASLSRFLVQEEEREQWAAIQPYDGFLGSLPDWMGPEIQSEFARVRNNLLRSNHAGVKVTPEIARLWLDRFCRIGEIDPPEHIPEHYFHHVEQLAHWRWVHSQGQASAEALIASPALVDSANAP
jgi:hypothetical protein